MGILVYADISRFSSRKYTIKHRHRIWKMLSFIYLITADSCDSKQYILQYFRLPSN